MGALSRTAGLVPRSMNCGISSERGKLADYRWLASDAARPYLAVAAEHISDEQALLQAATSLRKNLSAERAHLVLEQAQLRRKANEKFAAADRMFFTPRGLEQATDAWIAQYKASRFDAAAIVDFCCGIGGDLIALQREGCVLGIDRDPATLLLAAANASSASLAVADSADVTVDRNVQWHIDPDRRLANRRTCRVELSQPGPEAIRGLLDKSPSGAIKLAPAAVWSEPWWSEAELEWIGRDRECRQLVAWFSKLARLPGQHSATVVFPIAGSTDSEVEGFTGEAGIVPDIAAKLGRYLFEPHATVLAAKLEGALATAHGLSAITPGIAYFTADRPSGSRLLSTFEVLDVLPYRIKKLKTWLAERRIGRLEVKKRAVNINPEGVRRQLAVAGDGEATLILTRAAERIAIFARRTRVD
jgi:THUMP domain-like